MRRTRKPLKARDLMIAVVGFALSLKLGISYSGSGRYWEEADFYARAAYNARFLAGVLEKEGPPASTPASVAIPPASPAAGSNGIVATQIIETRLNLHGEERKEAARRSLRFADRLDHQRAIYRRAAFLPWLPWVPDVP